MNEGANRRSRYLCPAGSGGDLFTHGFVSALEHVQLVPLMVPEDEEVAEFFPVEGAIEA